MKLRLFLDTNVILDVLLERNGYQSVLDILQLGIDGKVELHTSILSMANIAYVARKDFSGGILLPTLKQISSLMEVLPMDNAQFQRALLLNGPDFEDVLQAVCAESARCQVIITHNVKDYSIRSTMLSDWNLPEILTPEAFLLPVLQVQ